MAVRKKKFSEPKKIPPASQTSTETARKQKSLQPERLSLTTENTEKLFNPL
jgi:hypothetical protein